MRGIAAFVLLLAGVFLLALPIAMHAKAQGHINSDQKARMGLEVMRQDGNGIQNAFLQVLGARATNGGKSFWEGPSKGENSILATSFKLILLEKSLEQKAKNGGNDLDLWFGECAKGGMEKLRSKILSEKRAAKCNGCLDFKKLSVDFRGNPRPLSSALLFHDGSAIHISKRGLTQMPESYILGFPGFEVCFGASLFYPRENESAIHLMREGFG